MYAALEIGIGACGLAVLWGLPLLGTVYTGIGGGSLALRAIVAGICLVPPAMLMGATLPVVANANFGRRFDAKRTPEVVFHRPPLRREPGRRSGRQPAAPASICLRVYDVAVATGVAVALNLAAAGVAWTRLRPRRGLRRGTVVDRRPLRSLHP